jgi:L-iditol 2-dehydrogenase
MKALRLHAIQDLRLDDEPEPRPARGEALLSVGAVGICGSDLHWVTEGSTGVTGLDRPLILGHEFAGRVLQGKYSGRLVAVEPAISCEACEPCLQGHPNLCLNILFAGHTPTDGALRQTIAWPERCLFPLPEGMDDTTGAMLEPLGVAIHTVDLGHLRPGMTVGVYGCGPIGLLILQVARVAGAAQIVATDYLPHRLEAARVMGAEATFTANMDGAERAAILDWTRGRGVDVAFEAAGDNQAVETAIETCKPGGRVVLCGIPGDNRTSFNAASARRKGLTLLMVRRMKHTYPRAIRLVEKGLVDVGSVVTHLYSLEQYAQAFATAEQRQGLKVIIKP